MQVIIQATVNKKVIPPHMGVIPIHEVAPQLQVEMQNIILQIVF